MSNSNKHIEEFLDYYLNKEQSPDYAVLITGCWGSGKTYFIRQYLEKQGAAGKDVVKKNDWLTGFEKYTVIYVSLFGVKTREDINKKIEHIFRPKINSKKLDYLPDAVSLVSNLAGIAVGTVLAATTTLSTGGSATPFTVPAGVAAGKAVGDSLKLFSSKFLENIKVNKKEYKRLVIVFDDLERADMRPCELFGYLNEYVEQLHIPCILLADKDKWEEAQSQPDDKRTLQNLSSTQEKVIGKIFQIQTSVYDIVDAWLSPENGSLDINDNVKKALWENRNCIYEMFSSFDDAKIKYSKIEEDLSSQQSEQKKFDQEQMKEYVLKMPSRNYRALKQTIKDFNHLCCFFSPALGDLILSPKSKETGFLNYFFRYFLIMKYGATIGLFDANEIGNTRSVLVGIKLQNKEFPAKEKSLSKWQCFLDVSYSFHTVDIFPMQEWLISNYFDKDEVIKGIESSSWFARRPEYLMNLMCESWWSLSDEQATECYKTIRESLSCDNGDNDKLIKNPTLLMKLFAVLSLTSKEASVDINANQLINRYLDNNSNAIEFGKIISVGSIMQSYSLEEKDKALLMDLRNRLLNIFNKRTNSFSNDELKFYKDFTSKEMEDFNQACNIIRYISSEETDFQWNMVNVERFLDGFCLIERYKRSEIIKMMKHRYLNVPSGYDMDKEKSFLSKLKNACLSRINQKHETPLPSVFAMKQMVEKIEEIENIKGLFEKEEKNK